MSLTLLRNEYVTQGLGSVPDSVLVEIVDEVYLPLIRGHDQAGAPVSRGGGRLP